VPDAVRVWRGVPVWLTVKPVKSRRKIFEVTRRVNVRAAGRVLGLYEQVVSGFVQSVSGAAQPFTFLYST
jgi:hypothetical protein